MFYLLFVTRWRTNFRAQFTTTTRSSRSSWASSSAPTSSLENLALNCFQMFKRQTEASTPIRFLHIGWNIVTSLRLEMESPKTASRWTRQSRLFDIFLLFMSNYWRCRLIQRLYKEGPASHDEFPAFLYSIHDAQPNKFQAGLLRSPFLIRVSIPPFLLRCFTSPVSVGNAF
jgi:hypothetical protein